MASNLAPPLEEITLKIDLTNPDSISRCLRQYLSEAPKSWIRIQGSHSIASQAPQLERVVDFDLKTRGLNARLVRVELGSSKEALAVFSTSGSDQNMVTLDEETIQRCCTAIIDLAKTRSYDRIIIEKDAVKIDHALTQSSIQTIAKRVVYGGNIDVTFHDTTSSAILQSQISQAQSEFIFLKMSWVLQWPGLERGISALGDTSNDQQPQKREQTWSGRLQAAMVDGEQGWIAKDDPVPPGIQFSRALAKYGLVDEKIEDSVHRENGQKTGTSGRIKFHMWGCDE